jgi:hypothetical protein
LDAAHEPCWSQHECSQIAKDLPIVAESSGHAAHKGVLEQLLKQCAMCSSCIHHLQHFTHVILHGQPLMDKPPNSCTLGNLKFQMLRFAAPVQNLNNITETFYRCVCAPASAEVAHHTSSMLDLVAWQLHVLQAFKCQVITIRIFLMSTPFKLPLLSKQQKGHIYILDIFEQ